MSSTLYAEQLTLEEIKDLPECLGIYLSRGKFTPNGREYKASCPIHTEKTGSCTLNLKNGRWLFYCFGACQGGGSVIDFVMQCNHLELDAAIRVVKEELGLEKCDRVSNANNSLSTSNSVSHILPPNIYKTIPLSDYIKEEHLVNNRVRKDWISGRGISLETAKTFKIGFRHSIESKEEDVQDILDKGWMVFPYIDGESIRLIKYRSVVRKENGIIRKPGMESVLFNADTISPTEDLYLVSGECDAVCLAMAGFKSVSLTSDTHPITPELIEQLKVAKRLMLAGDNDFDHKDNSGQKAMRKFQTAIPEALLLQWPSGVGDANDLWDQHRKSGDLAGFRKKIIELTEYALPAPILPELAPVASVECIETPDSITKLPIQPAVMDMPDSVLDGRLGEICQRRLGGFPLAYSWPALVTCAGMLVPLEPDSSFADTSPEINMMRTNLFFCPVGSKGSGKSQVIEQALNCLGMWPTHKGLLVGKWGSGEGMLADLKKSIGDQTSNRKLLFPDELGHLLSKANIENSSFSYILNGAYYGDHLKVTMAKGKTIEIRCRVSLAGGVVDDLFGEAFGSVSTGGLHDRFIFGLCPKPYIYLWRPYNKQTEILNPIMVDTDPDVWECRDEWVKSDPEITPRIAEHALRVAGICAAFDGRTLRGKDLGPALEFAKYQTRVRLVLQPNPGQNPDARCAFAILNYLLMNAPGGQPVERRTLYRGIHGYRFGPGVFDRALTNLRFNEEIGQGKVDTKSVVFLVGASLVPNGAIGSRRKS